MRQMAAARKRRLVFGGQPGASLEDLVRFDREGAAPFRDLEELDQVRVEVELLANLAQACRESEEQSLIALGQPERRVKARADESAGADRTTCGEASHAGTLGALRCTPT